MRQRGSFALIIYHDALMGYLELILWAANYLTYACAHSWAGSVLRSSREPGSGCQTVPRGVQGRGAAGAELSGRRSPRRPS